MDRNFSIPNLPYHQMILKVYKPYRQKNNFSKWKMNEEEEPWYVHHFVMKLDEYKQKEKHISASKPYKLDHYKRGQIIILETHKGEVFEGTYLLTSNTKVRIEVLGVSQFPFDLRYPEDDIQYFYASEIRALYFLHDENLIDSEIYLHNSGISYQKYLHGKNLIYNNVYVPVLDICFIRALKDISKRSLIGLVAFGSHCEKIRYAKISFLVIATEVKIYLFDIKLTPRSFWDEGLCKVLQDKTITKVVFDSKTVGDLFLNRYWNIKMENVFDVQSADYKLQKSDNLTVKRRLRLFPDIAETHLNLPQGIFYNSNWLQYHWWHNKRPAEIEMKLYASLASAYLIPLYKTMRNKCLEFDKEMIHVVATMGKHLSNGFKQHLKQTLLDIDLEKHLLWQYKKTSKIFRQIKRKMKRMEQQQKTCIKMQKQRANVEDKPVRDQTKFEKVEFQRSHVKNNEPVEELPQFFIERNIENNNNTDKLIEEKEKHAMSQKKNKIVVSTTNSADKKKKVKIIYEEIIIN